MLTLPPAVKLYVALGPVSLRKGFDGLSLYVQTVLRLDPLSGHLFLFFNRRKDQVSVLYWDSSGYALWKKRLERGRFRVPVAQTDGAASAQIEAADLQLLLEGIDLLTVKRRPRWTPSRQRLASAS